MLHRVFAALVCLLVFTGLACAEVVEGKITSVTIAAKVGEHHWLKVSIDGQERGFNCNNAKFLDEAGKEIKEGIKSMLIKVGAEVKITTREIVLSEGGGQKSTRSQTVSVQLKKPKEGKK